jgi:hypothetical protein
LAQSVYSLRRRNTSGVGAEADMLRTLLDRREGVRARAEKLAQAMIDAWLKSTERHRIQTERGLEKTTLRGKR